MSAFILIRDGNPWWLSPDIWTVPGLNPDGPPGIPTAGESSFIWARIENTGRSGLENIQLNFFWSNPATGVLRSNSTQIGTAFATVPEGESREVLCLTPWVPAGVNGGHECLVVEAIHSDDPLPTPLPDPFDPPSYDQIAQRNIDLIRMASGTMRSMAIQIAAPKRLARVAHIKVIWGDKPLPKAILDLVGLNNAEFVSKLDVCAGLALEPSMSCDEFDPVEEMKLELVQGSRRSVQLQLAAGQLSNDSYGWVSVIDTDGDAVFGGITFILSGQEY